MGQEIVLAERAIVCFRIAWTTIPMDLEVTSMLIPL
jgi:hypothetical protein